MKTKGVFVFYIFFLNGLVESCTFPSYMDGNWTDSKFDSVQFYDRTVMYLPGYSISNVGTTTNMLCYINQENKYVLRTVDTIHATLDGKRNDYYHYICMEITQITNYSFYYYLQSEQDLNYERTIAIDSSSTLESLSTICSTTISLQLFHIMVKDGFENDALQTCSTPLLRSFNFELTTLETYCAENKTGFWDFADSSQKILNISYTGINCDVNIGHSATSNVGCLLCIKSDDTYITSILNLDETIENAFYSRFTCMMSKADGENVTMSQRARICHTAQTPVELPDTSGPTIAALVYLAASSNKTSAEANCFPRTVLSSTPSSGSSKSLAWIAAAVVPLLLLIAAVVGFIYWREKVKGKSKVRSRDTSRRRNCKFDIRTAVLAGLGNSRQRQKLFIRKEGSDILVIKHNENRGTGESLQVKRKIPFEDYDTHKTLTEINDDDKISIHNVNNHKLLNDCDDTVSNDNSDDTTIQNNTMNDETAMDETTVIEMTCETMQAPFQISPTKEHLVQRSIVNDEKNMKIEQDVSTDKRKGVVIDTKYVNQDLSEHRNDAQNLPTKRDNETDHPTHMDERVNTGLLKNSISIDVGAEKRKPMMQTTHSLKESANQVEHKKDQDVSTDTRKGVDIDTCVNQDLSEYRNDAQNLPTKRNNKTVHPAHKDERVNAGMLKNSIDLVAEKLKPKMESTHSLNESANQAEHKIDQYVFTDTRKEVDIDTCVNQDLSEHRNDAQNLSTKRDNKTDHPAHKDERVNAGMLKNSIDLVAEKLKPKMESTHSLKESANQVEHKKDEDVSTDTRKEVDIDTKYVNQDLSEHRNDAQNLPTKRDNKTNHPTQKDERVNAGMLQNSTDLVAEKLKSKMESTLPLKESANQAESVACDNLGESKMDVAKPLTGHEASFIYEDKNDTKADLDTMNSFSKVNKDIHTTKSKHVLPECVYIQHNVARNTPPKESTFPLHNSSTKQLSESYNRKDKNSSNEPASDRGTSLTKAMIVPGGNGEVQININQSQSRDTNVEQMKLNLYKSPVSDRKLQNEKKLRMRKKLMKIRSPYAVNFTIK